METNVWGGGSGGTYPYIWLTTLFYSVSFNSTLVSFLSAILSWFYHSNYHAFQLTELLKASCHWVLESEHCLCVCWPPMQRGGRHGHYRLGTTLHWQDSETGVSKPPQEDYSLWWEVSGKTSREMGNRGRPLKGRQTSTGSHTAGRENSREGRCSRWKTPRRRPVRARLSGHMGSWTLTVFTVTLCEQEDPHLWSGGDNIRLTCLRGPFWKYVKPLKPHGDVSTQSWCRGDDITGAICWVGPSLGLSPPCTYLSQQHSNVGIISIMQRTKLKLRD